MADCVKIVLTGGPCGGKSSAIKYIQERLTELGVPVFCHNETATRLMQSGKTPENMGNYEFHKLLFSTQLNGENLLIQQAERLNCEKAVLLCDRGLLDNRAYVTAEEFEGYSAAYGMTEEIIRNRYDAVFHLVTAADGAEGFYSLSENSVRTESIDAAKRLDSDILALWIGCNHLRIIDNSTDFNGKLERLLKEILAVLGIPQPLEIERKFLIEYPDLELLNSMKTCRKIPITQAYLNTPEEGRFRIRKRGAGESALYIKTVKKKISALKRVEIEKYISEKEYNEYLSNKDCVQGILSKDRYCIVANSTYYELDVYPFWKDKATLEIELLSEDEGYVIPDFVKLIREVSFEKEYRNKYLAVQYGNKQ